MSCIVLVRIQEIAMLQKHNFFKSLCLLWYSRE
jgi:hypothetical protein